MRYFLKTFGCRVNQAETEDMRAQLARAGWAEAASLSQADLCVVNTCTVTRDADREALKFLRRAARHNPSPRLVVTGCLAFRSADEVRQAAPDAVILPRDQALARVLGLPQGAAGEAAAVRARALLKVQDGCDGSCSYCAVPLVRPRPSSAPLEAIQARARRILEAGASEIVLCGIRLGRYQRQGLDLAGLIESLLQLPGDFRLRLSSLEIGEAGEALASLIARSGGRVCPHLHLPLQSGCEATLRRMNRPYTAAEFARRVQALRRLLPSLALFTDVITGFPGETEEEFRESLAFAAGLGLKGLHVFRYSARPGTPAVALPGQVPAAKIRERLETWQELDARLRAAHLRQAQGQERLGVPLKSGTEAVTEDFLTLRLDRPMGPGLWRVQVQGRMARILGLAGASSERYN